MAPCASKTYPITKGLYRYCLPSNAKEYFPQFHSETALAKFGEIPMDSYLKQVMRYLKDPFGIFPEIICHLEFVVRVCSAQGPQEFSWNVPAQEIMKRQRPTMLQALEILNQALIQSNVLVSNLMQLGHYPNIHRDELDKMKKLEDRLLELIRFLDEILIHYSYALIINDSKNAPDVGQIKRMAKKLYKVMKDVTPTRLNKLIPMLPVREEDILCSVLGLREDLADRLASLSPKVRDHQCDMYFLLDFLEEGGEYSESLTDPTAVAIKLQEMGFTENRSAVVAEWISAQPFPEHQSLMAWVQDYITSMFKYDIFLNDHVPRFPFQEKNIGNWFAQSFKRDDEEDDTDTGHGVDVLLMNTNNSGEVPGLINEKIQELNQQDQHKFLYHGTDHGGAQDILKNGINLGAGKRGCDFSDGFAFYLTDTYNYAVEWAKRKKAGAVLVFRIVEDSLRSYRGLDLGLPERKPDWNKVTEHFKKGKELKGKLRRECYNCQYIEGPISGDGGTQKNPRENAKQICIKKANMAEEIGILQNICAVIFFQTH